MPLADSYVSAIKGFEGYSPKPTWDYKQWSVGYGTKGQPGETLTQEEADRRLRTELSQARNLVQGVGVPMTPGQEAALTSLTYNAGPKWMDSGLGQAVLAGDWTEARNRFVQYNKAGGTVLPGLVKRRQAEAQWFNEGSPEMAIAPIHDSEGMRRSALGGPAPALGTQNGIPVSPRPQQFQAPMGFGGIGNYLQGLGQNPLFLAGLTTLGGQGPTAGAQIARATQQGRMQEQQWNREQDDRGRMQATWERVFPGGQAAADHPLTKGAPPEILSLAQTMGPEQGLQFLGKYALSRATPKDLPNSVQEYNFDMEQRKAAGQPPVPYGEWSQTRKQPLVQMTGEKEYEKTRGKALAEEFGTLQQNAQDATTRIAQLQQVDSLLSDPSVYTGTGAESINALKRAGKTLLGLDFEGVGSADAARRISTEMALSLKQDLPGPMSNADRDFLMSIPPNIGDSAEGRKLLVELMTAKERRKVEIARLANDYRRRNMGRLDEGWYDVLGQYNEDNPLVTPDMVSRAQAAAKTAPQPTPAAGVAKRIATDDEYDALPSGTLFIGPDGQVRRKP